MSVSCFDPDIQRLMERLGLPKNTREFTLHVAVDEMVTVEATYYPDIDAPDRELITRQYKLVEIESGEVGDDSNA